MAKLNCSNMDILLTVILVLSLLGLLDGAKHRQWSNNNHKKKEGRRNNDDDNNNDKDNIGIKGRGGFRNNNNKHEPQQDSPSYSESRPGYGSYPYEPRESPQEGVFVNSRKSAYKNSRNKRSEKPNIIMIITDDQDISLGSMNFMPKTLKILQDEGAFFHNAYVTTPMCCPSRSSMLTGMYVHNHNVFTNNDNCSSIQWQQTYEINNFGRYLTDAGYRTGYFGKYLNEYTGTYIPPGWTEWVGLIRNTRFYNYSLNFNGEIVKHGNDYHKDYLTDLIANDSVTFLKQSKQYFRNRPVAMVLSMPAPHGPEDAAPQYQDLFPNVTTHRTPSWNYAPNPDKQWLLQSTAKMEPIHMAFTDMLQRKRLQTLQSVDDAVEKLYNELESLGELDNTYFLYTADHGYHLGQYGIVKGKAMPYEFDIKVPFYLRGPKIPKGVKVPNIVLNVDIAPTFLDMGGIEAPDHMDGRSILKLFEDAPVTDGVLKKKKAWRDSFLVERGKVTNKKIKQREMMEANKNVKQVKTKLSRLDRECEKGEYKPPCGLNQQWECKTRPDGTLRMYKCRQKFLTQGPNDAAPASPCVCPELKFPGTVAGASLGKHERKQQKSFLRQNVNQPKMLKPKFIKPRSKRSVDKEEDEDLSSEEELPKLCKVVNSTVICEKDADTKYPKWKEQREVLDYNIQTLKEQLDHLRDLKKNLKKKKPTDDEDDFPLEGSSLSPSDGAASPESEVDKQPFFSPSDEETEDKDVENNEEDNEDEDGIFASLFKWVSDSENDYDDEIYTDSEYMDSSEEEIDDFLSGEEFHPEDFQDEEDKNHDSAECVCDVMMSDQQLSGSEMKKLERIEKRRDRKMKNRERKRQKLEEREQKREEKQKGKKSGKKSKNKDGDDPTRDCSSGNMKCFEHSNDHWKTAPFWSKKRPLGSARKDPMCTREGLECNRMDNYHWKTAPHWTLGPFCFCPNSNNNTYWCVRTINDTHNFLYCEFITGFISYYDLNTDPYQLRNAVRDLSYPTLTQLHRNLEKLRTCKGSRECTERTRPENLQVDLDIGSGDLDNDLDFADDSQAYNMNNLDLNPIPGKASVTYESDQSGEGGFYDLDLDPKKEDFLFWTNIHRLDTTFIGKSEINQDNRNKHRHRHRHKRPRGQKLHRS